MSVLVRLNDAEEAALFALPPAARVCYILGLRPFMDFKTGIVGDKRRVSYQSLMELLEFEPDRGSHLGAICKASPDVVRSELARLERAGLLVRMPKRKRTDPLRLKMVLADVDGKNPSQEEPQMNPKEGAPKAFSAMGSAKSRASSEVGNNPRNKNNDMSHRGAPKDEPHTSVLPLNNIITTSAAVIDFRPRESSYQNKVDQWVPSSEVWAMLKMRGVDPVYAQEKLGEYQIYWRDRGTEKVSWDSHFISHCVQQWRMYGHVWRAAACAEGEQKGFIDKHLDRSWADGVGGDE